MNADGSAPVNLTNNAAADDHPVWSPSGAQIAFVSDRGGHRVLYVMSADGSGLTAVAPGINDTSFAVGDDYVSWSPDGAKLTLAAAGIVVANANGSGTTRLVADVPKRCFRSQRFSGCTSSLAAMPTWSPDGTRLAYHLTTRLCRGSPTCTPANPQSSIWIVNPDGTGAVLLTSEAGTGAIRPVWKP
jgi:Tol biopolymer transport system component